MRGRRPDTRYERQDAAFEVLLQATDADDFAPGGTAGPGASHSGIPAAMTSTTRALAAPSQPGGTAARRPRASATSAGTSAIRSGARPSSTFVPSSQVMGRS